MSAIAGSGQTADDANAAGTSWKGVWSIAAGTFLLVATEFLPIGLLSPLATNMRVSEGLAGLSVTAPGFIAAFAAPLLLILARDADRRIVVVALTAAIVLSNLISAVGSAFLAGGAVCIAGALIPLALRSIPAPPAPSSSLGEPQ